MFPQPPAPSSLLSNSSFCNTPNTAIAQARILQITSAPDVCMIKDCGIIAFGASMFRLSSTDEENKARVRAIMAGGTDPEAPHVKPEATDVQREKAAETIQKNYRGHRARRQIQGLRLDPQTRWIEAVKDAQYQRLTTPEAPIKQTSTGGTTTTDAAGRRRWIRAAKIAQRAAADDDDDSISGSDLSDSQPESMLRKMTSEQRAQRKARRDAAKAARKRSAKMMDLQYFLEMVDQKHRYGSHLRKYHAYWNTLETDQSFFYWLDHGDGLHMDMPECSRKKLDAEQVRYLSREERLDYMVKIDEEGLLRWAKNGELVWTKDELYKDSIKGIVRTDENVPAYKYNVPPPGAELSSSSDAEEDESLLTKENDDDDHRYANEKCQHTQGPEKVKHVSAAVMFNHMIRTSMKKGRKWIFVADTSFNLYIGYKQSGAFQHSSFMHGSRITAAGVIKVKHGQLRSLAPLSGHYRPSMENFKSFVQSLEAEGCDMSRVNISKSYAILVGTEKYTKSRKELEEAMAKVERQKERLLHPEKVKVEKAKASDNSESARREKEWLERQRQDQSQGQGQKKGGGLMKRLTGKLKLGSSKKESGKQPEMAERRRGIAGTRPEDSVTLLGETRDEGKS